MRDDHNENSLQRLASAPFWLACCPCSPDRPTMSREWAFTASTMWAELV